jgi:hypothetical protein
VPEKGTTLEFLDGARATVVWVVIKIGNGYTEVGCETEPGDHRAGARGAGWEPVNGPPAKP